MNTEFYTFGEILRPPFADPKRIVELATRADVIKLCSESGRQGYGWRGDAFMAGLMVGLTRGADTKTVVETACRLGAIVASHDGATPLLPQEIIWAFFPA